MASFTQPLSADDAKLPESLSSTIPVSEMCKMNAVFFFKVLFHITLNFFVYRPIIIRMAWQGITDNSS